MNRDIQATWKYHDETKHSWESVRTDLHYLDWSNQPRPFKIYKDRPSIPLPNSGAPDTHPALAAIADSDADLNAGNKVTLLALSRILDYSAGITKERSSPGGTIAFRAAACAGALYPIEVYVLCADVDGIPPGLYHFNPRDRSLVGLREGPYETSFDHAAGGLPGVATASALIVFTAITWRSSWKYRSRAYRYHYWDNGMIVANALAACAAVNLPAKLVIGFIDDEICRLVGIDGRRELPLSLLAIGSRPQANHDLVPHALPELTDLSFETIPLSSCEIDYPLVSYMHSESSLTDVEQVREWRAEHTAQSVLYSAHSRRPPRRDDELLTEHAQNRDAEGAGVTLSVVPHGEAEEQFSPLIPLQPHLIQSLPTDGIGDVILRRGSTRRFARKQISFEELSTIIDRSTRGFACDCMPRDRMLNDVYMIISRVDGLAPGAYYYQRGAVALEKLKEGDFSRDAAYLTLEQDLGGDSSATLFYMTDLDQVLKRYGNRGYRVAQMEAGIMGGKTYVAAYALRRGATGLTFYDDDVTRFFSPHATGKSCMLVMSIGVPGRRPLL